MQHAQPQRRKTFRSRVSNGIAVVTLWFALSSTSAFVHADVMLGAYVPGDGFDTEEIDRFKEMTQGKLAFVNLFTAFNHDWDLLAIQASNVVAADAMPMISWMPVDLTRIEDNLLPEIAMGQWDEYLEIWAEGLLDWVDSYAPGEPPRLMIRFAHEFNSNWYPYGDSPAWLQLAWQHIHDTLGEWGANDYIDWVWSVNYVSVDSVNDISRYYPGDEYVDWTAIDSYNWGSNYAWTEWQSLEDLIAEAYTDLMRLYPEKPVMLSEIASSEPADQPNPELGQYGDDSDRFESKEDWYQSFIDTLSISFPAIRAIAMFNHNKELGWSLTGPDNTGSETMARSAATDFFTADFLSPHIQTERLFIDVVGQQPDSNPTADTTRPGSDISNSMTGNYANGAENCPDGQPLAESQTLLARLLRSRNSVPDNTTAAATAGLTGGVVMKPLIVADQRLLARSATKLKQTDAATRNREQRGFKDADRNERNHWLQQRMRLVNY